MIGCSVYYCLHLTLYPRQICSNVCDLCHNMAITMSFCSSNPSTPTSYYHLTAISYDPTTHPSPIRFIFSALFFWGRIFVCCHRTHSLTYSLPHLDHTFHSLSVTPIRTLRQKCTQTKSTHSSRIQSNISVPLLRTLFSPRLIGISYAPLPYSPSPLSPIHTDSILKNKPTDTRTHKPLQTPHNSTIQSTSTDHKRRE